MGAEENPPRRHSRVGSHAGGGASPIQERKPWKWPVSHNSHRANPSAQVFTHEGHLEIAVVDLGRDISDALRASWDAGHPLESGVQSVWLQPLFATGTTGRLVPARQQCFLPTAELAIYL